MVDIDGEPWFVAKDVLTALYPDHDVRSGGPARYLASIDGSERKSIRLNTVGTSDRIRRGNPNVAALSESGLYKLILRADGSPTAAAFQNWVTREVLPSIRKNGGYIKGQEGAIRRV